MGGFWRDRRRILARRGRGRRGRTLLRAVNRGRCSRHRLGCRGARVLRVVSRPVRRSLRGRAVSAGVEGRWSARRAVPVAADPAGWPRDALHRLQRVRRRRQRVHRRDSGGHDRTSYRCSRRARRTADEVRTPVVCARPPDLCGAVRSGPADHLGRTCPGPGRRRVGAVRRTADGRVRLRRSRLRPRPGSGKPAGVGDARWRTFGCRRAPPQLRLAPAPVPGWPMGGCVDRHRRPFPLGLLARHGRAVAPHQSGQPRGGLESGQPECRVSARGGDCHQESGYDGRGRNRARGAPGRSPLDVVAGQNDRSRQSQRTRRQDPNCSH